MIRALPFLLILALAAPAGAGPNPQLAASIQNRLDRLGFHEVDASRLSTRQAVALHFELRRHGPFSFHRRDFAGRDRVFLRQKVEAILRWDPPSDP